MFSAKRKKEAKSEIPQWKLDMLAAESGGSAHGSAVSGLLVLLTFCPDQ